MIDGYQRERKLIFSENDSGANVFVKIHSIKIKRHKRIRNFSKFSMFHIAFIGNVTINIYGVSDAFV
jgi:hypothetical protein